MSITNTLSVQHLLHAHNDVALPMMDANRIPFVTQASQPSEDEEDQCQADSQPSLPPAPPNPATFPLPVASSKPRNITRENNSKHLVQSGLFGMRVIPSHKMISVRQFKKKTGSKVRSHSRVQPSTIQASARRRAAPPTLVVGSHIDPESAKIINSILIQDKLDQCKARSTQPKLHTQHESI